MPEQFKPLGNSRIENILGIINETPAKEQLELVKDAIGVLVERRQEIARLNIQEYDLE